MTRAIAIKDQDLTAYSLSGGVLCKANDFIESTYYKLDPRPTRLLALLIAQIQYSDDPEKHYKIDVEWALRRLGHHNFSDSEYLFKQFEILRKARIEIDLKDKIRTTGFIRVIDKYKTSSNVIGYEFNEEVQPLLFELKKRYSKIRIDRLFQLKSPYAWKLYELIIMRAGYPDNRKKIHQKDTDAEFDSLKSIFRIDVEYDKLRKQLGVLDHSSYPTYSSFKKWVLNPAMSEILKMQFNGNPEIDLRMIPVRRGRNVTRIRFLIKILNQSLIIPVGNRPTAKKKKKSSKRTMTRRDAYKNFGIDPDCYADEEDDDLVEDSAAYDRDAGYFE